MTKQNNKWKQIRVELQLAQSKWTKKNNKGNEYLFSETWNNDIRFTIPISALFTNTELMITAQYQRYWGSKGPTGIKRKYQHFLDRLGKKNERQINCRTIVPIDYRHGHLTSPSYRIGLMI